MKTTVWKNEELLKTSAAVKTSTTSIGRTVWWDIIPLKDRNSSPFSRYSAYTTTHFIVRDEVFDFDFPLVLNFYEEIVFLLYICVANHHGFFCMVLSNTLKKPVQFYYTCLFHNILFVK